LGKRFEIVYDANLAKFRQNKAMCEYLLNTGDLILAEAAPNDKIWGIGLAATDPRVQNPAEWNGENVLGEVLMKVRETLRKEQASN